MIDLRTLPARYQRYYTYLEPVMVDPLVRGYFGLIASFLLVTFFVIFALSPTINTILTLNKKIADQKTTITALDTKINNLVTASQNYSQIESLIPFLDGALPKVPTPQTALETIIQTATSSGVSLGGFQFQPITLYGDSQITIPESAIQENMVPKGLAVLSIGISASGPKDAVQNYLGKLEKSWRYLRLRNINFSSKDNSNIGIDTSGFAYYYSP